MPPYATGCMGVRRRDARQPPGHSVRRSLGRHSLACRVWVLRHKAHIAATRRPRGLDGWAGGGVGQLHRCLRQSLEGTRQIIFVAGAAGMGKTTLVEGFSFPHCAAC
jgi:hypothetical protein